MTLLLKIQILTKNLYIFVYIVSFLMDKSDIPMLLIQSKHDGLIDYSCAERFYRKAVDIGNKCELYSVEDKKNTHSWYTAGMFLEKREENKGIDRLLSYVESL